ncbi:GAF domain-containing protein [Luteitalea sp.]|uniref:GAF domain-containing protein n=1 Tax=Luteitalea sp. TaxID=2004800 RepID=UPI000A7A28B2|nr:GAF domain-containing protein [Luteitalea sp.]
MTELPLSSDPARAARTISDQDTLRTLFDLGRRVMSVLSLEELLQTIPRLIERLIQFDAFAIYMLDASGTGLHVDYAVGYPTGVAESIRLAVGDGLVGLAVQDRRAVLVNDLDHEPNYKGYVPGMRSSIIVPLAYRTRTIGALNILSSQRHAFTEKDLAIVRQFGVHAATALENARLYSQAAKDARVFETLLEISREISSILDVDQLFERLAAATLKVIDYKAFAILLLNPQTQRLEIKHLATPYGINEKVTSIAVGEGLTGYAALHREVVVTGDVREDPRYIELFDTVTSEMAVPLLYQGDCIGVLDLSTDERDAFDASEVEFATLLGGQFAIAIQNARLYHELATNQARIERELRIAQRVQTALLPQEVPSRIRGLDVAARFDAAREVGGDFHDYLDPLANQLVVALGDVSGKGVPAALYSAFASELVRSRTFRKRYVSTAVTPSTVLQAMNTILHERGLLEMYCTLCYGLFDVKRRTVTVANSGVPYPLKMTPAGDIEWIDVTGVPLGSFPGIEYDECVIPYAKGDVFLFYSDGVSEAMNEAGDEFGREHIAEVMHTQRGRSAREIVDAIFEAVAAFRGDALQNDDITAVAVRAL